MYGVILRNYKDCTLIFAENGQEALSRLTTENNIDLILLDINMPKINGIQLLKTIKAEKCYTNIPIIIASTEGKEDDIVRGLSLGAKGYIIKPFKPTMLYNLIDCILNKHKPAAA